MAESNSTPAGAAVHRDHDVDVLEALWARIEKIHDAYVIAGLVTGKLHPRQVHANILFSAKVIELARVELYRRLLAAYARNGEPPKPNAYGPEVVARARLAPESESERRAAWGDR